MHPHTLHQRVVAELDQALHDLQLLRQPNRETTCEMTVVNVLWLHSGEPVKQAVGVEDFRQVDKPHAPGSPDHGLFKGLRCSAMSATGIEIDKVNRLHVEIAATGVG